MADKNSKTLVLIDSHALIHRAFHALPPLSTQRGERVNAVYGFILVLFKVLKELKPDYVAAAFDLPGPTFRHKEFEEYKATRVKAPDELYAQIGRVKEVVSAFGIPIYEKAGFEADDVIGTVADKVKSEKLRVKSIVVTGDLDTLQLIDDNTRIYTLRKGVKDTILYDEKMVVERYGLKPEQMPDYRGLKGDPSDNIPGVPGIGEKTATELLKEFGTVEKLYETLENSKFKVKSAKSKLKIKSLVNKLIENKDQAIFSKYLATIKRDVALKFNLKDAKFGKYDLEKIKSLFKELEFFSLINRLGEISAGSANVKEDKKSPPAPLLQRGGLPEVFEKIEQARQAGILSDKVYEIEKQVAPVIEQMEKDGIKVDAGKLKELGKKVDGRLISLEKEIHKLAGTEFNISSPQQLAEILFEKLKLETKGLKKTPGRVISTAAPELIKLKGKHKIIDEILEHRELAKLKSTYIDALPGLIGKDGRLHTQYDQLGTATGRLSSKNPNLQNIPVKTELGNEIRKAFVAEKGFLLLAADYSQLELRIVASLAEDKKMIDILKKGEDIHLATAAEVFEVSLKDVTPKMRKSAKALNFGVIYGMSMHGFAQAAGIDFEKAKAFIKKYFEEFEGVARYVDKTKKQVARDSYAETLFGRKRFLPEINSSAWDLRASAERAAINFPVQGTAADLVKMAMVGIKLKINLPAEGQKLKMLLQVHDELLFEAPENEIDELASQIKEIMENVYQLEAPLIVKIEIGPNWGELSFLNGGELK
ncbi:MAG: DNA polymerase [bacterium]